jgi:FkbM family methyltransferase
MKSLATRLRGFLSTAGWMWKAGVSARTIAGLLFRRWQRGPDRQIRLRCGLSIQGAAGEPLKEIFRETWFDQAYGSVDVDQGQTVIDIGANVGMFTFFAAARAPQARIIAVEPTPRAYRYLLSNIRRNRLENVVAVQVACGSAPGRATLFSCGDDTCNSLYNPDGVDCGTSVPICEVEVVTLGQLFERFEIDRCRLLKLDCEGAEYEILLGADARILARIDEIVMEYHVGLNPHRPEDLLHWLESHGFRVTRGPDYVQDGYLYARRLQD